MFYWGSWRPRTSQTNKIAFQSKAGHPQHALLLQWPWPWPNDLGMRTWPKYYEDVVSGPKRSKVRALQTDRQTGATEDITTPH